MQELESRFNEAYSQSLGMKDERIQVLEKRIEDLMADNEQLKDESSLLKRQNKRMQRKNSASNSPNTSFRWAYNGIRDTCITEKDCNKNFLHLRKSMPHTLNCCICETLFV